MADDSTPGTLSKLAALTLLNLYNRRPGPKLSYRPTNREWL